MHSEAFSYLESPCCHADLVSVDVKEKDVNFPGEIYAGQIECALCRETYNIVEGVPILITTANDERDPEDDIVAANKRIFDYMWEVAAELPLDDYRSEEKFLEDIRIEEGHFRNAVVLETGIGPGRFFPCLLDRKPAFLFGADISDEVFRVYKAFVSQAGQTRFCVVQADMRNPPFKKKAFDIVLSARAVQHMPDPIKRLAQHVDMLRPGGRLACLIFSDSGQRLHRVLARFREKVQVVIGKFPLQWLYPLTFVPTAFLYFFLHAVFPLALHIPWVGERLPLCRVARQWRRFRFASLRLFVLFDLLVVRISWLASETALKGALESLGVSHYSYELQHEAIWSIEIVK